MAKKKDNLKDMSIADLKDKVATMEESLRVLRFNMQGAKSKNVKESLSLKKMIARLKTEIAIRKKS